MEKRPVAPEGNVLPFPPSAQGRKIPVENNGPARNGNAMAKAGFSFRDLFIIGGGIAAGFFVWQMWTADAGRPPSASAVVDLAKTACRTRIEAQLTDPRSAEWQLRDWPARQIEGGRVIVEPDFRARNALGGMVRSRWVCEVQVEGTTRRVLRLEEV